MIKKWGMMGMSAVLSLLLTTAGCSLQSSSESGPPHPAQEQPSTQPNGGVGQEDQDDQSEVTFNPILPAEFGQAFLNGEWERIYTQMSDAFQTEVTEDTVRSLGEKFNTGVESYRLLSETSLHGTLRQVWVDESESKGILVVFSERHTIEGLQIIEPLSSYPDTDDVWTQTEFIPPFEGEWFTFWGGTNELINYHYAVTGQRYAYDFIILKDGTSYEGDPTKNESYYAFGADVIAPAAGTVVEVVNDIPDNEPVGQMNAEQPAGNYVIIDHGHNEYSVIAHFKQGSITVSPGEKVSQGDYLGLCGNSGNSSEAHIHFHVADKPSLTEGQSIRIRFAGLDQEDYVQGQYVQQ